MLSKCLRMYFGQSVRDLIDVFRECQVYPVFQRYRACRVGPFRHLWPGSPLDLVVQLVPKG